MEVVDHVDALEREGRRLVEAAERAGPDAEVPSCPGWRVRHLLAHVGFVHRWAARYVTTALVEMVEEPGEEELLAAAPPDGERCPWVAEGHAALVRALRDAPASLECWTFLQAPSPLAMWARRQAHETAVHRVDAELAEGRGACSPVDAALAADGIDELLLGFFGERRRSRRRPPPPPDAVRSFGLEPVDRPERWTVRLAPESRWVDAAPGEPGRPTGADIVVRVPAQDLYLLLWHRRGAGEPGAEALERSWAAHRVTWA